MKCPAVAVEPELIVINRNMRCIEIARVLKSSGRTAWINRNMRCIEMFVDAKKQIIKEMINRNMRCIEIDYTGKTYPRSERLIGT